VAVVHCTFFENEDAAGKGSSIRTNVFNTAVSLRNCLLADGDANPLDPSGAGRILSEGGNVADDDAMVWISQGGAPMALFLLDNQSDRTSQLLPLEPLADNGGQTRTHALPVGSPARVAGLPGSGTATDQRDVVRAATPDAGAFEAGTFKRLVINEIQFDPASGEAAYIEVVNPRDSETLQIGGLELWVTGTPRHIFTPLSLAPGTAVLVRQAAGAITPTPPGGFPVQTASVGGLLGLGLSGGIVEVRGPSGVVASAMYLSKFRMSGEPTVELRGANESVTRSCEFLGALLPGPRTPGEEVTGIPLLEGNAPPVAYDDATETDEDTALEVIDVLANDFDADRTDVIRVVELPPTLESSLGATLVIVNDSTAGVAVSYDPTNAPGMAVVSIVVTGVNDAPVARDDGPFATNEDTVLAIPFVPGVLGNDTDVDTTDTLSVVSAEPRSEQDAMVTFDGTRFLYNPTVSELFLQKLSKKEVIIDSFEYTIGDGNGGVATATILVRVTGVNDAPVAFADTAVAFEDGPVKILAEDGVLANDTDIDMNTLAPNDVLRALPSAMFTSLLGATVKLYPDGSFDYLPNGLFEGLGQWANLDGTDPAVPVAGSFVVDTFEYMVTDDGLVFANGDTCRVSAGQTGVDLKVLDNDVNYGVLPRADLVVTQVGLPSQGGTASVAPGGGSVFYSPAFGFVGTETFTYEVAAGTYGFCLAEVTVKVVPASGPIVGKSDAFTVAPNGTGFLDLLANDLALPGGTPVALVELTEPNQGGSATIAFQGGRSVALYAPVPGFHGTETFSYVASAGGGTTFGATVTITVPNRAGLLKPQADHFFVVADTGENILPVLANDGILPNNGEKIEITFLNAPQHGTAAWNASRSAIVYTPTPGYAGPDTFGYEIGAATHPRRDRDDHGHRSQRPAPRLERRLRHRRRQPAQCPARARQRWRGRLGRAAARGHRIRHAEPKRNARSCASRRIHLLLAPRRLHRHRDLHLHLLGWPGRDRVGLGHPSSRGDFCRRRCLHGPLRFTGDDARSPEGRPEPSRRAARYSERLRRHPQRPDGGPCRGRQVRALHPEGRLHRCRHLHLCGRQRFRGVVRSVGDGAGHAEGFGSCHRRRLGHGPGGQ